MNFFFLTAFTQHISFFILTFFSIVILSVSIVHSFLLLKYSIIWIYLNLFIHSPFEGHLISNSWLLQVKLG